MLQSLRNIWDVPDLRKRVLFTLGLLADGFFVCNLRSSDITLYFKPTFHPVNENFQVQLAHTPDDRLIGFLIAFDFKRRIFFAESLKRKPHTFLIVFCLGLDSK